MGFERTQNCGEMRPREASRRTYDPPAPVTETGAGTGRDRLRPDDLLFTLLDADVLPVHRLHPIDVTGNVDGARLGRFGCRVSGQRDDAVLGVHVDVSVVEFGVGREG